MYFLFEKYIYEKRYWLFQVREIKFNYREYMLRDRLYKSLYTYKYVCTYIWMYKLYNFST